MSDNVIGRKIRMAMIWHRYDYDDACRIPGVTKGELREYVLGEETPDSTTLIAVSKALGVSINWLMTDLETTDLLMREGSEWRRRKFRDVDKESE